MSARIERPKAATLVGGALVMLGAWLPWLTMFAGLQRYGGLTGLYGWLLFAGGTVALLGGLWKSNSTLRRATALLGLTLMGFTVWLLAGLFGLLRQGLDAMLVSRPGPGLFVALLGALLIIFGSLVAPQSM